MEPKLVRGRCFLVAQKAGGPVSSDPMDQPSAAIVARRQGSEANSIASVLLASLMAAAAVAVLLAGYLMRTS